MAKNRDLQLLEKLTDFQNRFFNEIGKSIIGQKDVLDHILIALLCKGHTLIIGVPGLAKTLMIKSMADLLDLTFSRIQFTPDLMPSDITGTEVLEEDQTSGKRAFRFFKGPIFGNIILADEINRTPPKTQAALLEAMQEHKVTAAGNTYDLEEPFFVLATQNPIEQEGTYPLPEAQLDRFMFNILIDYPSRKDEVSIVQTTTDVTDTSLNKVISENSKDFINEWIDWGAGPRASQYLILGAKAKAVLNSRPTAEIDDVKALALPVLRHRVLPNFNAEAEGMKVNDILKKLIEE